MNYRIKQLDQDQHYETRVMDVNVAGKKIITPAKSIDNFGAKNEINEIFVKTQLKDIVSAVNSTSRSLNKLSSKINPEAINIIIPEYNGFKFEFEGKDYLSKYESRLHVNTDIVVVPRWKGVFNLKNEGTLLENLEWHTKRFIEESRKLNGKMIMGNIPMTIPEGYIDSLLKLYFSEGIFSFVLDYGTCLPSSKKHIVRDIQKKLDDAGEYESSLLYSTNVCRTRKRNTLFPADDFMNISYGIDIIGSLHIGYGSDEKEPSIPKPVPKSKLFNPNDYTYIEKVGLSNEQIMKLKIENCRTQNIEALIMSKYILENGSISDLLNQKPGAKQYVDDHKQKTFDIDFGFTVSENLSHHQ